MNPVTISTISTFLINYQLETKDYVLGGSILLNLILILVLYKKYYYNRTQFVNISIKKHKLDFPEFKIKIKNTGLIPVEMDPPVVTFKKRGTKRLFQVRNGLTPFPLALLRKEEYDFFIDLARFYSTDSSLITYPKVFLEVRDKNQRKLSSKRIRIK